MDHGEHAGHSMHAGHGEPLGMHLRGMWVAFGITAGFIVYFLHRVSRALAQREAELRRVQEQTERSERLASVATLAAGAAHELSTPLSTIAVIAKELERQRDAAATAEDARLIRREVDRCRDILGQMAGDAGESPGEVAAPVRLDAIVGRALEGLPDPSGIDVDWLGDARDGVVVAPLRAVAQALRGVLKNALDASPSAARVTLRVEHDGDECRFVIVDRGAGMTAETVTRATEPFFTTKETGQGMGLGLFLARSVFDFLGGSLDIASVRGEGTCVSMTLPATIRHMVPESAAGAA
jgi:two-component system sensor histidine kinase RegB